MTDEPSKYFFRQRQQNRLYDTVIDAIEIAAADDGVRRKDIADKLAIAPSQVTRLLSGPANWETDTVSDLLYAIGAELDFNVVYFKDRAKGNRFHPVAEALTPINNGRTMTSTPASGSISVSVLNPSTGAVPKTINASHAFTVKFNGET